MNVILIIIFCLIVSAFFSASETAMTAVSRPYINERAKNGSKKANLIKTMLKDSQTTIATLLLANNFINIILASFITAFLIKHFNSNYVFIGSIATTILILIFGEVLPKSLALLYHNSFVFFISPVLYVLIKILKPITKLFLLFNNIFFRFIKPKKSNNKDTSIATLRGAIGMLTRDNEFDEDIINEKEMLNSILDLYDIDINEIMIHRKNVICVDIDTDKEELIDKLLEANHSIIPAYKNTNDNIIGLFDTSLIFKNLYKNNDISNIQDILIKPNFFPETSSAFDLLIFFQQNKEKIAIVVDEYGGFMGIVTLKDILEEIVGDLKEDTTLNFIQKSKNSIIANGDMTIRDINRKLKWELPDENATTIAGLILYETGKIPSVGNIFALYNFKFEIIEKRRHQISKIKITPLAS